MPSATVTRLPDVPPPPAAPPPDEPPDLLDYRLLRDWTLFAWHAPRRHKPLAALCFLAVVGASIGALVVLPRTWDVQARILTQRNPLERGTDREDAPTRAARELILRRDNIMSLLGQTRFVERHLESRAPAARLRAWLVALVRGRDPTPDELKEGLADAVEDRLWAVPGSTGTVDIGFRWSNRELTFDVVEAAVQNFLELRHSAEVSSIDESIAIYEEHAARLAREIAAKTKAVEALEREARSSTAARPRVARPAPRVRDEDGAKLEARLAARRRTLADVEEYRQRRLAELQAQLAQQETMYADRHPVLVATRRSIEALSGPSPQVAALRGEVADLEREVARRGARPDDPAREPASPIAAAAEPLRLEPEDPRLEQERYQLWMLVRQHSGLLERIDDARVQIDTARAGFKYRYSVVTPPQLPKAPLKPKPLKLVLAGIVGGVCFAFFAAVLADLRSGRILERWQVERGLGVPVLAEHRER